MNDEVYEDTVEELPEELIEEEVVDEVFEEETPEEEVLVEVSDITTIALEALNGEWGSGQDRRVNLANAGHDPKVIQAEMNRILNSR